MTANEFQRLRIFLKKFPLATAQRYNFWFTTYDETFHRGEDPVAGEDDHLHYNHEPVKNKKRPADPIHRRFLKEVHLWVHPSGDAGVHYF